LIKRGKTRDTILKVREVMVFDTEVIYHQYKSYRTRDVTEKARGSGFEETVRSKGSEGEMREDIVGEKMGVDFYKLRGRERSPKIEIG
jgi:hypothetical protein